MSVSLLNMAMLGGFFAVAIPVIVHLLNRRRFDVVEWGAMQFLELGERTRQKIKLSDLLLLLLRMIMIAILALTFMRPFVQGNLYLRNLYPEPVDLVIILDSSYSMGWTDGETTPHARAIQHTHHILDNLTSVDRVAIIDARHRPELITPAPLTDPATARLELEELRHPDGTADLTRAITQSAQLLNQSYSTRREIVVITDRQAISWASPGSGSWNEFLKLRQAAAVPIQLSAIDVSAASMDSLENFHVNPLSVSREVAVIDTPVTIRTRVGYNGTRDEAECDLLWSVDGQQLSREVDSFQLRPGEESIAELTTRFADAGPHVVTATVNEDGLPGDNVAQLVVDIVENIPVTIATPRELTTLNLDGNEPTAEYYLKNVFGDPDKFQVWVSTTTVQASDLHDAELDQSRLLFLLGPASVEVDPEVLTSYLQQGGSIVFLPDHDSTGEQYQELSDKWKIDGQPVLPVTHEPRRELSEPVKIDFNTLSADWLNRFRQSDQTDLRDVLVRRYWPLIPVEEDDSGTESSKKDDERTKKGSDDEEDEIVSLSQMAVSARLENGDPLFLQRKVGRGQLIVSAITFDSLCSDLVQARSYVPLLHELIFAHSRTSSNRNLLLTQPLIVRQLPCQLLNLKILEPDDNVQTVQRSGKQSQVFWQLRNLKLSGIYRAQPDCAVDDPVTQNSKSVNEDILFSVTASREESELSRLSALEQQDYADAFQLKWRVGTAEVLDDLATASGGLELWPLLLLFVTMLLVCELLLTRKLVQGGHHQIEPSMPQSAMGDSPGDQPVEAIA